MRRIREALAVALILLVPAIGASSTGNDAGSGQDAGDAPGLALALAAAGAYQGGLTPVDTDRDWYALDAPTGKGSCGYARATPAANANLALTPTVDRSLEASVDAPAGATRAVALVARGASDWFTGVEAPGSGEAGSAAYDFESRVYSWADLDPDNDGEGADAGNSRTSAKPRPGACFAGQLAPASGDADDYFSFQGVAGSTFALSLAAREGSSLSARLLGPDGLVRTSVLAGGASVVVLDADGTWHVAVSAPTSTSMAGFRARPMGVEVADVGALLVASTSSGTEDYLLGASLESDDPPNTTTCRPTCTE